MGPCWDTGLRGASEEVIFILGFDVERGMPDFTGDGDCGTIVSLCLASLCFFVSGVNPTCFKLLERLTPIGVVGTEGRSLARFNLLGLLAIEGITGSFSAFFELKLELVCFKIDFIRSNLLGVRSMDLLGAVIDPAILFIVADFNIPRGVLCKFGFDGDLDKLGI